MSVRTGCGGGGRNATSSGHMTLSMHLGARAVLQVSVLSAKPVVDQRKMQGGPKLSAAEREEAEQGAELRSTGDHRAVSMASACPTAHRRSEARYGWRRKTRSSAGSVLEDAVIVSRSSADGCRATLSEVT